MCDSKIITVDATQYIQEEIITRLMIPVKKYVEVFGGDNGPIYYQKILNVLREVKLKHNSSVLEKEINENKN